MTRNPFDAALEGDPVIGDADASEIDSVYTEKVKGVRHRARSGEDIRELDDAGYRWLRAQYVEERGSSKGWADYCREYGIINPDDQRRIWDHEATTEDVESVGAGYHCKQCKQRAATELEDD